MEMHKENTYAWFVGDNTPNGDTINGRKMIEHLEQLGAHNPYWRNGENPNMLYYIAQDGNIHTVQLSNGHLHRLIDTITHNGRHIVMVNVWGAQKPATLTTLEKILELGFEKGDRAFSNDNANKPLLCFNGAMCHPYTANGGRNEWFVTYDELEETNQ